MTKDQKPKNQPKNFNETPEKDTELKNIDKPANKDAAYGE